MPLRISAADAIDQAIDEANATIIGRALSKVDRATTLGEILEGFEEAGLGSEFNELTVRQVRELLSGGGGRTTASPARRGSSRSKAAADQIPAVTSRERSTRTKEGRDALDTDILAFLGGCGKAVRTEYIRGAVGGTAMQVRESLKRLVERMMVKRTGQARATEYEHA